MNCCGNRMSSPCNSQNRFPQQFINWIIYSVNHPTGNWIDFNRIMRNYKDIYAHSNELYGVLCTEDVPAEPSPYDYPVTE